MSRPKPTILVEKVDKSYKTDQVLASEGMLVQNTRKFLSVIPDMQLT